MHSYRKTILFLIPSLGVGGMERVMSELLNYFSQLNGVDCYLVLYGKSRKVFYDMPPNVVLIKPDFEFNDSSRFRMTLKTMRFLRSTVKRVNPDSILSFGELWNSLVLLSLRGLKVPIYISDRCSPNKSFGKIQDNLRRFLYPKASGIVAQTQIAKDIYSSQFKNNNIAVIGNPIRRVVTEEIDREKVIVSVGRLISTKNFDRLIDIFARINDDSWKLIIIGGDAIKESTMSKLKSRVEKLNKESSVIFTGKSNKVDYYLSKASIFAFTSSSEGFPNVIGEAMSAGLPVVAYDCIAGPSDMIEDGKNGYLVPLFDDEVFESKLRFLMDNPQERARMGVYAKESIDKYSLERIGEDYFNFMLGNLQVNEKQETSPD